MKLRPKPATSAPIQEHSEGLQSLKRVLGREALAAPGTWARRRLDDGTVVSLRKSAKDANRWQLAIARDLAPSTLVEKARFEERVVQIRRAMGTSWRREDDAFSAEGSIAATFTSVFRPNL